MARRRRGLGYVTASKGDLKRHMTDKCRSHYWDPDTMRFFKSRLLSVHPGENATCFVTSEKGPDEIRKYTVKRLEGCTVRDYGEFQAHLTARSAKKAAWACAKRTSLDGSRRRR